MAKLNWFKSLWLSSEERKILKEGLTRKEEPTPALKTNVEQEQGVDSPYLVHYYSNKVLTVVMKEEGGKAGEVYSKLDPDKVALNKLKQATTPYEVEAIFVEPSKIKEQEETPEIIKEIKKSKGIFEDNADFEMDNNNVYLKGVRLALPTPVYATFVEILEKLEAERQRGLSKGVLNQETIDDLFDSYQALKMFWIKLALNPIDSSRRDLLSFVKRNEVRITKNGNLVLYRRIVSVKEDYDYEKGLPTFISQQYYKVKKSKKSPKNYFIYQDSETKEYFLQEKGKAIKKKEHKRYKKQGILKALYETLPAQKENKFRSSHSGKNGQLPIQIGKIYRIPESEIDLDNDICASGGLHAAAFDYDYGSFGDTPVVVLVNPSKAITVPTYEIGKMRTVEMFIACVNDKPRGQHFDEDNISAFDEEYHDLGLQELEEAIKNKSFSPIAIKGKEPRIALVELDAMRKLLKDRVKTIK